MLEKLFQGKDTASLVNPQGLRDFLASLPVDNVFRALDMIMAGLKSLAEEDISWSSRFAVAHRLDEAAQSHLKRLLRDYLYSPRLSRSEENRLWTISHDCWAALAAHYERCLKGVEAGDRGGELQKSLLPLLVARSIAALGATLKWTRFRYGPMEDNFWVRLGRPYLMAEKGGFVQQEITLYPEQEESTTPAKEYLKVLIFQASSLDCLRPAEIELAEALITELLPDFIFTAESRHDSVYWVDPAKNLPPVRLARLPEELSPTLRFFQPGLAEQRLATLMDNVQQGVSLSARLNSGGNHSTKALLSVMSHLGAYWAPIPPQRLYQRHVVKHRVEVLPGFANALVVFSPGFGGKSTGLPLESWVVENVSRGGFGATVQHIRGDWLKVGAFLALQPEVAENWVVGLVRRYRRTCAQTAEVGIETISRRVLAMDLQPCNGSGAVAGKPVPVLWLQDNNPSGEIRFILPAGIFASREHFAFDFNGRRALLVPKALVEQWDGYELIRYQLGVSAATATPGI